MKRSPSLDQLPHLTQSKTGIYGYRRRVPDRFRPVIDKTEIIRSLRTTDPKQVPGRYAKVHAEVERLFTEVDKGLPVSTDVAFDMAVASLKAKGIADKDGSLAHLTRDDRSEAEDIILKEAGFNAADELIEALEDYPDGKAPLKLQAVSQAIGLLEGNKHQPSLSYCLSMFLEDRGRRKDKTKKAWLNYERERKRIISAFTKLTRKQLLTDINKGDARKFVKHLEDNNYSMESIKKQVAFMKALTSFSVSELELSSLMNPWINIRLAPSEEELQDNEEKSFTPEQVRNLLSKTSTINDDLQDIVRLLAFTGARLAEVAGLEVRDVDLVERTISIRLNSIRRVKNKASIRVVPIVDDASFKALSARCKDRKPDEPVFPRYGRDGGADSASAALSKWLKTLKLRSIHGLRHTMKDALRAVGGVDRDVANSIQGHTAGDVASKYGTNQLVEMKRDALTKARKWLLGEKAKNKTGV